VEEEVVQILVQRIHVKMAALAHPFLGMQYANVPMGFRETDAK
jgi:hypothetical protein